MLAQVLQRLFASSVLLSSIAVAEVPDFEEPVSNAQGKVLYLPAEELTDGWHSGERKPRLGGAHRFASTLFAAQVEDGTLVYDLPNGQGTWPTLFRVAEKRSICDFRFAASFDPIRLRAENAENDGVEMALVVQRLASVPALQTRGLGSRVNPPMVTLVYVEAAEVLVPSPDAWIDPGDVFLIVELAAEMEIGGRVFCVPAQDDARLIRDADRLVVTGRLLDDRYRIGADSAGKLHLSGVYLLDEYDRIVSRFGATEGEALLTLDDLRAELAPTPGENGGAAEHIADPEAVDGPR